MKELKTLKDLRSIGMFPVRSARRIGIESLPEYDEPAARGKMYNYSKAYTGAELREEAIKRVLTCGACCGIHPDLRCEVCKREVWFNNLTEEDLK